MSIPLLSELRQPPVIGRYYMVPTVLYYWHGRLDHWPVIGPLHHDHDIHFPHLHFHVDGRFLLKRDFDKLESGFRAAEVSGSPVSENDFTLKRYGRLQRKPVLRKRRCSNLFYRWNIGAANDKNIREALNHKYDGHAIPLRDGRLLCPHRKADLSQFPPDENGIVICPLHGMAVCVTQTVPHQCHVSEARDAQS